MAQIHVPLLQDGTDVWVPVEAEPLGGSRYRLPGTMPAGQIWAFQPGTVVATAPREFQDGRVGLAAIKGGGDMGLEVMSIDHVQIAVPRALEAACLRFYREVFAFPELEKPPALKARGGAWFRVGALQMHIGVDPDILVDGKPVLGPRSKRHICFLVGDLAAAKAAALAHGVAIEEESVAEGLARFFIRDPAGNRIEIGKR